MPQAICCIGTLGFSCATKFADHFAAQRLPVVIRYFDPSYYIRSVPASTVDSVLCDSFARHAVHAAMAGKTDMIIGLHAWSLHPCAHADGQQRAQASLQPGMGAGGDSHRTAGLGVMGSRHRLTHDSH